VLLEVVEKLLALLIIVAMLILVMFLALPDSGQKRADGDPGPTTQDRIVTPVPTEPEPEPEPAIRAQPNEPASNGKVVVPDPRSRSQPVRETESPAMKEAPASPKEGLAQKQDSGRSEVKTSAASKQPKRPDRLPMSATEPVHTVKSGKIRPKVRTETVVVRKTLEPAAEPNEPVYRAQQTRTTVQSRSRPYVKPAKYRDRWDRTDYYECEGGRCDCSCDQPYWSRSGPCWN
jgi:type IV secretory pathway VirB10-like protein